MEFLFTVHFHSIQSMAVSKQDLVSTLILIVQYTGLWHTEKKFGIHPLALLTMFCFFGICVFQTIALFIFKNDIDHLFEVFSVVSFCGMGILKLFSLSYNSKIWLRLLNEIKALEHQLKCNDHLDTEEYESDIEIENNEAVNQIKKYTKKFKRVTAILCKIYFFTAVLFILSPFIEYVFGLSRVKTSGYPHILPSWNPFDSIHIFGYIVIIVCETISAVYCVCIHFAFDLTAIGIMIFVCGQFSFLFHQSERIGGKGKVYWLSKKRNLRAHARIVCCHTVHIKLTRFVTDLDGLLKNIMGVYFFLATLTLCTVAVRLKSEQISAMQLVSLAQYMCGNLTQLYVFCSYGDAVYNESSISAGQGPFGAAIWCLSPKIRREIAILSIGMKKPRHLHAGPFNTVNLRSFIQIVRAAYSYYAVLGSKSE